MYKLSHRGTVFSLFCLAAARRPVAAMSSLIIEENAPRVASRIVKLLPFYAPPESEQTHYSEYE
jgi:hypothetical protein